MSGQTLTIADVERLTSDSSAEVRVDMAQKVANQFDSGELTDQERDLAEDICRAMLSDAEVRVRAALSETLKNSKELPHDMAVAMARDVDTVALPVLEFSEVLSESDLLAIVASESESKQVAIAHRAAVAPKLADALVEKGSEHVVAELLSNDGAEIGEAAFSTVLEKYSDSDRIKEPMALRESLPVGIAERLVKIVSDRLQDHISTNHELPADLAGDLIMRSRERATMSLSGAETAHELVKSLVEHGRLTPSIVCRAVCTGDMAFFESAISVLSSIPLSNVRTLIHDRGQLGMAALYDRTGLPKDLYPVIRTAVDIGRETDYDGDDDDRERYVKQMIERVVTKFADPGMNIDPDTLDYLLRRVEAHGSDGKEAVA